jgi:hypothetical protein
MGIQYPYRQSCDGVNNSLDIPYPVTSIEQQRKLVADHEVRDHLLPLIGFIDSEDAITDFINFEPVIGILRTL